MPGSSVLNFPGKSCHQSGHKQGHKSPLRGAIRSANVPPCISAGFARWQGLSSRMWIWGRNVTMAGVAQLVRAPVCGTGGRRFETGHSPHLSRHGRLFGQPVPRGLHAAGVAELVDALDLGSSGENRGGSSPSARTIAPSVAGGPSPPVVMPGNAGLQCRLAHWAWGTVLAEDIRVR